MGSKTRCLLLTGQEVELRSDYRVVQGTYTTRATVDCGLGTVVLGTVDCATSDTSHDATVQDCAVERDGTWWNMVESVVK